MPLAKGGFLIRFDEQQRASMLRDGGNLEDGFSDALSKEDWELKQWEVCGLMFQPEAITHWALARRGKSVATGKVRVEFTEISETGIRVTDIEQRVGGRSALRIVSARSGVGGRMPPGTWADMKSALGEIRPDALQNINRLELLRDESAAPIERAGAEIVAKEKDAVGLALEIFDQSGGLRKTILRSWVAPEGAELGSFLSGVGGVRTIEDHLIARDSSVFPGAESSRATVVGAVFSIGGRKLEVFNVNRTRIEESIGVDLIYRNDRYNAWTLVQYKSMKRTITNGVTSVTYRPDPSFDDELARMNLFRQEYKDAWLVGDGRPSYRLSGDGFFFKLCSRVQLEVMSDTLLPGMYLAREFVQAVLANPATRGPRGGRLITFENTQRHLSNTLFAELVGDGWIGTRGISSNRIARIVHDSFAAGRAIVIARQRPGFESADPNQTLEELGI
jgi:hypothetical protein